MNLLKLTWKNIVHKPMNTMLSIVLLSFGIGIISLMLLLKKQLGEKFDRNIKDIDFVLAAKGSPLQSILANVYHVDAPTGNIKVSEARRIIKNPMVEKAIPLAYGDNFQKFRIVGTNADYPNHYGCVVSDGKMFEQPFEATLGSEVARETQLKVGDTFTSTHGYDNAAEDDPEAHHHDKPFKIVGILEKSGSAIDNLILTTVETTWMVHEHGEQLTEEPHVHEEGDTTHIHDEEEPDREMTAYLILKRNKGAFGMLSKQTENTTMQLANVAVENSRLMNNFGIGLSTVTGIAIVITLLSFISIFISLFNSLKERKYELALMRTMGASRITLFRLLLQEGVVLVLLGYAAGIVLSRIGLNILGTMLEDSFKYDIKEMGIIPDELILLAVTLTVGVLASLLPAIKALRMDISKTLSNA